MARPFRWEKNVRSGIVQKIELTDAEIADAAARTVLEAATNAVQEAERARQMARQARLDALLDKIEADPTILSRL